jgi:hypothetical protein
MEQITLSIKQSDDMMGERQERSLGLLLVKRFLEKIMVKYGLKVKRQGSSFLFYLPSTNPLVQKILR